MAEELIQSLKSLDVLHFDRTTGKKCRFPKQRENLIEILTSGNPENPDKPLEGEDPEKCLKVLPKNFCKKDLVTG
jgi:hypothetical protein